MKTPLILLVAAHMALMSAPALVTPVYAQSDWTRGEIIVTNDWNGLVNLKLFTHQREPVGLGAGWNLAPGQQARLGFGDGIVKARGNYKIKVGNDWGWVDVADVGFFANGYWNVTVTRIWRATHHGGGHGYSHGAPAVARPDWL